MRLIVLLLGLALAGSALALHPKDFQSREEELRYQSLARELRCVMCQNESLHDSPAGVADVMRYRLLDLIREGKTDAEIQDWFVARYGEFVLYEPRLRPTTWALWFGPLLLLIAGGIAVFVTVRRQQPVPDTGVTPEDP